MLEISFGSKRFIDISIESARRFLWYFSSDENLQLSGEHFGLAEFLATFASRHAGVQKQLARAGASRWGCSKGETRSQ